MSRAQDLLGNAMTRGNAPWLRGRLVENVRCEPNVETVVMHKLGRKPRGFLIVGVRTADPDVGTEAADLVSTEMNGGQAKLLLVTAGTSPRICALWFW